MAWLTRRRLASCSHGLCGEGMRQRCPTPRQEMAMQVFVHPNQPGGLKAVCVELSGKLYLPAAMWCVCTLAAGCCS